jgi:hypothetical protein
MALVTALASFDDSFPHSAAGLPSPMGQLAAPGLPPPPVGVGVGVGLGARVTAGLPLEGEPPPQDDKASATRAAPVAASSNRRESGTGGILAGGDQNQDGEQVVT